MLYEVITGFGAIGAPGKDHFVAGLPRFDQLGDERWRVLHVGIHHHDRVAAGMRDGCRDGRLVAEIAREVDPLDLRAGGFRLPDELQGARITSYNVCYTKLLRLQRLR